MNKKELVIELYYNKHLKQNRIAEVVETSPAYVSQVLSTTDKTQEKEQRHQQSLENKKNYNKQYWETYERPIYANNDKEEYDAMKDRLSRDSYYLSTKTEMSDQELVYNNLGAYHTDKNGNLKLDKSLKPTSDMPKFLNRNNVKLPTQKYKHKVCMER